MTPKQRKAIREMFGGHCAYCGCVLPERGWHVDHVQPVLRETKLVRVDRPGYSHKAVATGKLHFPQNDVAGNLMPACAACNIFKGAMDVEGMRGCLGLLVDVLRRNASAFRHLERFGRVAVVDEPVTFYFERQRHNDVLAEVPEV